MEVISMKKEKNRISDVWVLKKILREDDEETFLLI
jgi:hypothetical protein